MILSCTGVGLPISTGCSAEEFFVKGLCLDRWGGVDLIFEGSPALLVLPHQQHAVAHGSISAHHQPVGSLSWQASSLRMRWQLLKALLFWPLARCSSASVSKAIDVHLAEVQAFADAPIGLRSLQEMHLCRSFSGL